MQGTFTKKELVKRVALGLKAMGYYEIEGALTGSAALFYKQFSGLILTLGLELSTRYKEKFTASFYLSPSFHWSYLPKGFPKAAYQRIGRFLTIEERLRLLDRSFSEPGVLDAWWGGFQEDVVRHFLEAVQLSEPRFLEQPGLINEILSCEEIIKHMDMISQTISTANNLKEKPSGLSAQPRRLAAKTPAQYFWAAEIVLSTSEPDLVSSSYVQLLAVDAWRCKTLKKNA